MNFFSRDELKKKKKASCCKITGSSNQHKWSVKDRVWLPRQQKNEVLKAILQLGGKRWQQLRSVWGDCSVCDGGVWRQRLQTGDPIRRRQSSPPVVHKWHSDLLRLSWVINPRDVISYHSFPSRITDTRVQHSEVTIADEERLGCGGLQLHPLRRAITVLLQSSTGIWLQHFHRQIF